MKTKRIFKIVLDIIMLVLLVLMFKKNSISMSFHEIGGLALIGLFIIHNLINVKWIKAVFGKFFSTGLNARTRIAGTVNFLLAIDFILIGVSGVLIAHGMGGPWKTVHYFCAALSIVLIGVHLGLHWNLIKNAFVKSRYEKVANVLGSVVLIAAIAYGIYSTVSTSFTRWISMPFLVSTEIGNTQEEQSDIQVQTSDENESENSIDSVTSATTSTSESNNNKGSGRGLGGGIHQKGEGVSVSNILTTLSSYLSIMILFAIITVLLSNLIIGKRKRNNSNKLKDYIIGECKEI